MMYRGLVSLGEECYRGCGIEEVPHSMTRLALCDLCIPHGDTQLVRTGVAF
jgi:hypothetical protein